jgi:hypothetical protein
MGVAELPNSAPTWASVRWQVGTELEGEQS